MFLKNKRHFCVKLLLYFSIIKSIRVLRWRQYLKSLSVKEKQWPIKRAKDEKMLKFFFKPLSSVR